MPRRYSTGVWLDAIPGLFGLFGMGELYLGKKQRAELFMIWTAGLYVSIIASFLLPGQSYYWGYLPIAWGVGYFLLLVDALRLVRRRPAGTAWYDTIATPSISSRQSNIRDDTAFSGYRHSCLLMSRLPADPSALGP
jgi:hypothetical protein